MIGESPAESAAKENHQRETVAQEVIMVDAREWEQVKLRLYAAEERVDALEGQAAEAKAWSDIMTEDLNKVATVADGADLHLNEVAKDVEFLRQAVDKTSETANGAFNRSQFAAQMVTSKAEKKELSKVEGDLLWIMVRWDKIRLAAYCAVGYCVGDLLSKIILALFN
jgi:hypothetical protein